jgi:hypothetical protein
LYFFPKKLSVKLCFVSTLIVSLQEAMEAHKVVRRRDSHIF